MNTRIQTWNEQFNVALSLVWLSAIMQAFWESNWSITLLRVQIVYQKKKIFGDHSVVNKRKLVYLPGQSGNTISKISLTHKLVWTYVQMTHSST